MRELPLLFLFGPTGVGKTKLLLEHLPGRAEVVAVDSVQVYRGLDIGSAKPTPQERRILPHHLIDIRNPDQQFDAGDFVAEAEKAVRDISDRGLIPVLSGGTAFYFKNFLFGLTSTPVSDPEVRRQVEEEWNQLGEEAFRHLLAQVDPVSAQRILPHDAYRLKRAREVWVQSGRPLSSFTLPTEPRPGYRVTLVGLERPRDEVWRRIDQRVDQMVADGLVDEVRGLLAQGVSPQAPALKGIGYAEFLPWLTEGRGSQAEAVQEVKIRSRQYAKRQMTFFRALPGVVWRSPDDPSWLEKTIETLTK